MDKSAIKNFAINARKKLKEQIEQKAYSLGIAKGETKKPVIHEDTFEVNGNKYEKRSLKHRDSLVSKINEKGYDQVIEEVAYTWFNRLIAIRFMEVNEYLPTGIRVLSSTDVNKAEPDVIREVLNLDLDLNQNLVYKLQDENKTEELFKYILIKQCNELGKIMPVVFEEIEDYTELLLPDNLLQEGSIIRDIVTSIQEDDWKEQVEIIGWIYQYYISEKKDEVFEGLKQNIKITKENIPAATQLFTPDWIVKYMVENSLGKLWLESHPNEELKSKWKYYLETTEQEPEIIKQLEPIREKNKDLKPEDIKVIDPCMGSGHILCYQFDVLYDIYKSAGYSEREIPKLILENNLYGLDIDDRASQLAYFAVLMKARSYNRRIFRERIHINICSIKESNGFPEEAIDFLVNPRETEIEKRVHRKDIEYLLRVFNDAKRYGSLIDVEQIDLDTIEKRIIEISNGATNNIFELQYKNVILEKILPLVKQAKIMSKKFDVVSTNPPYLGYKSFDDNLSVFLKNKFPKSNSDLFACFIERCISYSSKDGRIGMITQHSWMFLSSYTELRHEIINENTIESIVHLGSKAFEEIGGEVVQTVAFVLGNYRLSDYKGKYIRLTKYNNFSDKEKYYSDKNNAYTCPQQSYKGIPDNPIIYWVTNRFKDTFKKGNLLGELADPVKGLDTCDNEKFVRSWSEVDIRNIRFDAKDNIDTYNYKWFPYCKGGSFRKWYGNLEYVVLWENDGHILRNLKDKNGKTKSRPQNTRYYFKKGITWSSISSYKLSMRKMENAIFGGGGSALFVEDKYYNFIISLLNSTVSLEIIRALNPTLNILVGDMKKIPIFINKEEENQINAITNTCIKISQEDWDLYEQSWNFKKHHLLLNKNDIANAFTRWEMYSNNKFNDLKQNEEKLNEIFINSYGLQKEISAKVEDSDITIRKADRIIDIKSFISYAIGCMFGRYSLDEEGLIYAGGQFNPNRYKTIKVDLDNVIPITDDEFFESDIVSRFIQFVKTTFSEDTLEENLDFIADTLGKKGNETSRQTIRRYFLKDFYKDHLQNYQKKPIYWLFDSGKNDGFKALIYMHRYDIGNVARVRTDYLHLLQRKYEAEINRLDIVMESNTSTREKSEAKKKKEKIQKQMLECKQYDQVIAHVANQKISIDLDDGVTVNYDRFQGIEVPQGEGKKPLKADLLAKIK